MEHKALERVDGPVGGPRLDYLAAAIAAMVVTFSGRLEKPVTFDELVAHFLLQLPWTPKPSPSGNRR